MPLLVSFEMQASDKGLKVYRNVHNAFCIFRKRNCILDFCVQSCFAILERVDGGVPNQIVGTKLLTALHNIIGLTLVEDVGMVSPLVLRDLAHGSGLAEERLALETNGQLNAVNLCGSLVGQNNDGVKVDNNLMRLGVKRLREDGCFIFS